MKRLEHKEAAGRTNSHKKKKKGMFVRQNNRLFQLVEFIDDLLLLRFFK